MVETAAPKERTYIMIKPDGVRRGLLGEIIGRFEKKGFKLAAMKLCSPGKEHMELHYEDLKTKKFFPGLIEYMTSGPVAPWSGKVTTPSSPDVRCSEPPGPSTPSPAPSVATSALMSAATSATAPTPLSPPTRRLPSGSRRTSLTTGTTTPPAGFTNERPAQSSTAQNYE